MPQERILIAEDEVDVLDMCMRALSREGYQVSGAHSGLEAIEMVKTQEYDLLLTDIKMPGLSGLQAFREIKGHHPDIIGVAITGYGSVDTAIQALKLGMDDFLLKPFSIEELRGAVSKALERTRLERENTRLRALIPLFRLSQTFMAVTDVDALVGQVLQVAVPETGADLGMLAFHNEASGDWRVAAVVTISGTRPPPEEYSLSEDILQQAAECERAVTWRAGADSGTFFTAEATNASVTTAVAVPLIVQRQLIGVLGLAKMRTTTAFSDSDCELISVLASQAGTAIQNARLFTRLRNAYEKLAALDHLKSEFISLVAHELRTPLAEISTYLALLEQGPHGDRPYVTGIARAAERLSGLMDDVTDLKFLEAGQIELKLGEVSLPDLVAEIVDQLGPLAACKRQSVATHIPRRLARIRADGPKLKIILRNLLSNAITFTPEGGEIDIRAERTGQSARIAVRDKGIGIPAEEWEWIFKPFYQVQSSLRREHGGIGIGLAIAQNLVELHGGRIWVDSVVGEGSTFYFTVPDCLS